MRRAAVASAARAKGLRTSAPTGFAFPMMGPSPSIADDAVHDGVMDRDGSGQVQDGVVDAPEMEEVLGPAVVDAREHAEEVLQAERDAHPVMGLHLGQADEHVGLDDRPGDVKHREGPSSGPGSRRRPRPRD